MARIRRFSSLAGKSVDVFPVPQIEKRAPTISDRSFDLLQTWLNTETNLAYILVEITPTQAIWQLIDTGGGGDVKTLTGDAGGAISPTAGGDIQLIGGGGAAGIVTTGSGTQIAFTVDANVPLTFPTDSGTATPAANALTLTGGTGIDTSGAGAVATFAVDGTVATSFDTNPATGTAVPALGVLTFAGAGGTVVSAAGSIVTITGGGGGITYADRAPGLLPTNTGTFATGAGVYTLPAAPLIGEVIEIVSIVGAGVIVTANAGQEINIGNQVSATAGNATSIAVGETLILRFRDTDTRWYATSFIGNWVIT